MLQQQRWGLVKNCKTTLTMAELKDVPGGRHFNLQIDKTLKINILAKKKFRRNVKKSDSNCQTDS